MISPQEAQQLGDAKQRSIMEIIADIDDSIKRTHGWYPWEEAILQYEVPLHTRNRIANMYLAADWQYVYHHTSSENLARPGLTIFRFSTVGLSNEYVRRMYEITK